MKRHEWVAKHPDPEARREMAKSHALAYHLEHPVQLLLPGRGWLDFELYDFQQLLLLDESLQRAANKMRQGGLTTGFGYEAWWKLTHVPGSQIMAISKNTEAVENFIAYVSMFDKAYRAIDDELPALGKDNKKFVSYPENHSWIKGVASDRRAATSFTATDVYFDETAHARYAEDIYQSMMPTLAKTGGTATLFSSPAGRGNLHHRIHTGREKYNFSLHQYEWWWVPEYNDHYAAFWKAWQAKDAGAIDKAIALARTSTWYKMNRPLYTDQQWAEEFECSFDANTANFFTTRQVNKMFYGRPLEHLPDPNGRLTFLWTKEPKEGHYYANGIDFGRKRDATVSWTYDITEYRKSGGERPAELVDFRYIAPKSLSWPQIIQELEVVRDRYKPVSKHDSTGLGDVLTDAIGQWSQPAIISNTGQTSKKLNLLTLLAQAMDDDALRAPRFVGRKGVGDAVGEHDGYQLADTGLRTDIVFANALAVSCFYSAHKLFSGVERGYSYVS